MESMSNQTDYQDRQKIVETLGPDQPNSIGTEEEYRDWVDEQFAELRETLESKADQEDVATVAKTGAQGRQALSERMDRLETRMEQLGGKGYERRRTTVLAALYERATNPHAVSYVTASAVRVQTGLHGQEQELDGIVELFDGALSDRTARRYMDDISESFTGCERLQSRQGGWGGGSDQSRLTMDSAAFVDAHGDDFDFIGGER